MATLEEDGTIITPIGVESPEHPGIKAIVGAKTMPGDPDYEVLMLGLYDSADFECAQKLRQEAVACQKAAATK